MPQAAREPLYCSFCGKSQHEVHKLIAGPGIFICNQCVDLCASIVREDTGTASEETPQDRESGVATGDKLELRVWLRLLTCTSLIEGGVRTRMRREFATTLPRFDVLAQLDRAPEGLSMGELSSRLMVSNGNVTGLIDRLVQEGLVSRAARPGDRRTQVVKLNARGKRAFDEVAPAHAGWIGRMLTGLDREEMTNLLQLLGKLKQSLNRMDEDGHRT